MRNGTVLLQLSAAIRLYPESLYRRRFKEDEHKREVTITWIFAPPQTTEQPRAAITLTIPLSRVKYNEEEGYVIISPNPPDFTIWINGRFIKITRDPQRNYPICMFTMRNDRGEEPRGLDVALRIIRPCL